MILPGAGRKLGFGLIPLLVLLGFGPAGAQEINKTLEFIMQKNKAAAASQKRVDKLAEDKGDLLGQFRGVQEQIASLRAYNAQVETLVNAQRAEVDELQNKIDNATSIGREATPLMLRMVEALEAFIGLDIPFLMEERKKRVEGLKELMNRADVAESEKYRRILEAYQIENEFGRTIEAYKGELVTDGAEPLVVNFLRIGRVTLVYMTQDEKEAGMWNQVTKAWEKLPSEYRSDIKKGLRVARKQIAPDLIRLPIHAPEVAK